MITKKEILKAISSGKSTKSQRDEYKESSGKDVEYLSKVYEELNAFEKEQTVYETKSSKLIGDYYAQIALLNSLKLKHIDKSDFKALQEVLEGDKQYQLIFKTEYPIVVKRGLSLKLHKELLHYLELEKQEAQNSKDSSLDAITKMLKELKDEIKPIADNSQFIKNVYTKAKPSEKKVSIKKVKEQKTLQLMEKMISRGKKR